MNMNTSPTLENNGAIVIIFQFWRLADYYLDKGGKLYLMLVSGLGTMYSLQDTEMGTYYLKMMLAICHPA